MAVNQIAMGINLRKNTNMKSTAFGKYYPEVDLQKTLSLRGFAQHMADHGSIYTRDVLEGVLNKICQCLPELVSQGVPVQLEPLGTFVPAAHVKNPVLNIPAMENADVNDVVKGIQINFLPYGVGDDNITSVRFKNEYCKLELRNVIARRCLNPEEQNPKLKKYVQDKTPIPTAIADYNAEQNGGD